MTPIPGDLNPLLPSVGTVCMWYTQIHTDKILMCIKKQMKFSLRVFKRLELSSKVQRGERKWAGKEEEEVGGQRRKRK